MTNKTQYWRTITVSEVCLGIWVNGREQQEEEPDDHMSDDVCQRAAHRALTYPEFHPERPAVTSATLNHFTVVWTITLDIYIHIPPPSGQNTAPIFDGNYFMQ